MNFGLAVNLSVEISHKSKYIQSFSIEIENYFRNKNYGEDLRNLTICVISMSPQFEMFFKQKKPKYTKGTKVINPDGIPFVLENDLEYSIVIDFETLKKTDNEESLRKILAEEILKSLSVFDTIKSKIKDFNISNFKNDLELYFKIAGLV